MDRGARGGARGMARGGAGCGGRLGTAARSTSTTQPSTTPASTTMPSLCVGRLDRLAHHPLCNVQHATDRALVTVSCPRQPVLIWQLFYMGVVAWVLYYAITLWLELSLRPQVTVRCATPRRASAAVSTDPSLCAPAPRLDRSPQMRFWFFAIPTTVVIVSEIVGIFSGALIRARPSSTSHEGCAAAMRTGSLMRLRVCDAWVGTRQPSGLSTFSSCGTPTSTRSPTATGRPPPRPRHPPAPPSVRHAGHGALSVLRSRGRC